MLELSNVSTAYGPVLMLRDVSICVREGELICLLGPNGAGKTTTFMTICGVVPALKGSAAPRISPDWGSASFRRVAGCSRG